MIYWFTGQPGHGKTVLASLLKDYLELFEGKQVLHIDGDDVREILDNKDYSKEGRIRNITFVQNLSQFLNTKDFDVVVSMVSPYRDVRDKFKETMMGELFEIYVHTSEQRERDHYHTDEYQRPLFDFIDCDTTGVEPTKSLDYILGHIKNNK